MTEDDGVRIEVDDVLVGLAAREQSVVRIEIELRAPHRNDVQAIASRVAYSMELPPGVVLVRLAVELDED